MITISVVELDQQIGVEVAPPAGRGFIEVFVSRGPPGPPGLGAAFVVGEIPTGAIDGVNMDYTTASSFTLLWVYLNGLRMKAGSDYNVTGPNSFSFTYPPGAGWTLLVDYGG